MILTVLDRAADSDFDPPSAKRHCECKWLVSECAKRTYDMLRSAFSIVPIMRMSGNRQLQY